MQSSIAPFLVSQPTSHPDEEAMRSLRQKHQLPSRSGNLADSVTRARLPLVYCQRDKCSSEKPQTAQAHLLPLEDKPGWGRGAGSEKAGLDGKSRCHSPLPPPSPPRVRAQGSFALGAWPSCCPGLWLWLLDPQVREAEPLPRLLHG